MMPMRFAVIGARLAGAYAGLLLARLGHEVLLFDETTDKEKPCGGGVTSKVLRKMAWLRENNLPHTEIRTMRMVAADGSVADLELHHPIHIYSRMVLDSSIRESALRAGARLIRERCLQVARGNGSWIVTTGRGEYESEFLVGADGATSMVRARLTGRYSAHDLSLALGFYIPGIYHQESLITVFQESGFRGYIWSFPRIDHSSVGILQWLPLTRAADLRQRVLDFIAESYPDASENLRFYAARVPCLSRATLVGQQVCGKDWALLGDAAGFVDAITAEGIYFALRSAELFAEAVAKDSTEEYEIGWRRDFGPDLVKAAEWKDRFYCGNFLRRPFTYRAVQATRHSSSVQELTTNLISGVDTYESMRLRMILKAPRILFEAMRHRRRDSRGARM